MSTEETISPRERILAAARTRLARRKEAGLCILCDEHRVTAQHCEFHHLIHLDALSKSRIRRRLGVEPRTQIGSRHHLSRLTEDDIPAIRARLAAGDTQATVARAYGVRPETIWFIAHGVTWRHVPAGGSDRG